jgi:hypothetical protein
MAYVEAGVLPCSCAGSSLASPWRLHQTGTAYLIMRCCPWPQVLACDKNGALLVGAAYRHPKQHPHLYEAYKAMCVPCQS